MHTFSIGDYVIANTFAHGKYVGVVTRKTPGLGTDSPRLVLADLASGRTGVVASGYCEPATKNALKKFEEEEKRAVENKWARIKTRLQS